AQEEPDDAARRSREEAASARGPEEAGGATAAIGGGDLHDRDAAARPDAMAAGATTAEAGSGEADASGMPHSVGEGSLRYADDPDHIPAHGSELSWSAAPHPGYVADPALGYSTKRLASGVLLSCLVLALGIFFISSLLTAKSSNGFGPAPWTGAVVKDGAVVSGINAQNDGSAPPVEAPAGSH
ncbi:MAG: hypothetical protein HOV83_39880, partial [Catenulispora sp.]|nr:hypothetical protein [Catenulispora sp.]